MLRANGPGFAGLCAGDVVRFRVVPRGRDDAAYATGTVAHLLVFDTHVVVTRPGFRCGGHVVNADNFLRRVRRGRRSMAEARAEARARAVLTGESK